LTIRRVALGGIAGRMELPPCVSAVEEREQYTSSEFFDQNRAIRFVARRSSGEWRNWRTALHAVDCATGGFTSTPPGTIYYGGFSRFLLDFGA
jgi:hypothetical protein